MKNNIIQKYPLVWEKNNFYIKIFCSIPNIATGIIITSPKAIFIIDPGDGILRDLNKDYSPEEILKISDIFISHGHHDHIGGVWSLLTYLSVMKKKTSLTIYYPKGCLEIESIYKAFTEVYSNELTYKIKLKEIENSKSFKKKDIVIKPFKVNHKELSENGKIAIQVPSLGYNFTYNNRTICYGGDTAFCNTLVKMAKGADLAIVEAGAENENDSELHMTMKQAVEIGKSAKEYFLVHVAG